MQQIFRFVTNNFAIVFLFALTWTIAWTAYLLWRHAQTGPKFPPLADVTVLFREQFASGTSHLSWVTRLGGASNCLSVVLTDSELWVTAFFPFTAFAGFYDLEHRIPKQSLTHVSQRGRSVTIDFNMPNEDRRRIVLCMRRAPEFMAALPPHVVT